jgi:hypothetical protein
MRPSHKSVLQRRTYKNLRSIQRRSPKNREGSSESGVLRLGDGWSDGEQPIGTQEGERASQKHIPPVSKEVEKLQEAAGSLS